MATTVLSGASVSPSGDRGPMGLSTLPFNYLSGLMLAVNAVDSAFDIDISQGVCRDTTNSGDIILSTTLTKRLDATWVAGNNQGGRETTALGGGAWWHVFAIRNPSTLVCDALFSVSPTAPTMPSGFTQFRRIGSIFATTSGYRWFKQISQTYFQISFVHVAITINTQSTGATYHAATPWGIKTRADLILSAYGANGNVGLAWYDPEQAGSAWTQWNLITGGTGQQASTSAVIWTSITDATIMAYLWGGSATGAYTFMETLGWYDDWLLIGK